MNKTDHNIGETGSGLDFTRADGAESKRPDPKRDNSIQGQLLYELQKGIPLEERPFLALSEKLGTTEKEIIEQINSLFADGTARRFGAIFDSHSLGYRSSLCAVDVPEEDIERVAEMLSPHPGITHSYQRAGSPNLWFTLTAPDDEMDSELDRIEKEIAPLKLLNLPAIKKFKVQVLFNTGNNGPEQQSAGSDTNSEKKKPSPKHFKDMSDKEKAVIGHLEGSLEVTDRPFDSIAADTGCTVSELLELLMSWKESGIIRRIGLILRHHKIGYTANGMCVWNADPTIIQKAGEALASYAEVSHCYERVVLPGFPYNLFAMIHADSKEAAEQLLNKISEKAGLAGGRIMFSIREFKKTSMIYVGKN